MFHILKRVTAPIEQPTHRSGFTDHVPSEHRTHCSPDDHQALKTLSLREFIEAVRRPRVWAGEWNRVVGECPMAGCQSTLSHSRASAADGVAIGLDVEVGTTFVEHGR